MLCWKCWANLLDQTLYCCKPERLVPVKMAKPELLVPNENFSFQVHYGHSKGSPPTGDDKPETVPCTLKIEEASIDNRYQERAVANGSLMMCEVQGAKEDFIRRWNTIFKEYPDVFEDSDCRKIIHDLTEDAVQYLLKIKEKTL